MAPTQQYRKAPTIINKRLHLAMPIFLLIIYWFISPSAQADTVQNITAPNNPNQLAQLKVTPKPCVALRKGQKCFLEVTFTWQHPKVNNYCLVNATTDKEIRCWQQKDEGEYSFDFQSKLTNNFALRNQRSTKDIARATIPVAWVYKSTKRAKSTWRLF